MTEKEWHNECAYAYFFQNVPGIGIQAIKRYLKEYGSYEKAYQCDFDKDSKRMLGRNYEIMLDSLHNIYKSWDTTAEYEAMRQKRIFCIPYGMDGYPEKLKHIHQPPKALYVKGRMPVAAQPLVGIIGARECSAYGQKIAKELGARLADHGIAVVSGLARGIDCIGQWSCLDAGGTTFGILGSGVDVCYPEENNILYERLCNGENGGGILSELLPGTAAERAHFPMRNRIISGLADALVVIEAKEKSGTLITVDRALEQGRNVYALPGRVGDRLSLGCNRLISQGAGMLWDIDDFIREVWEEFEMVREVDFLEKNSGMSDLTTQKTMARLTLIQKTIVDALDYQYQPVDVILATVVTSGESIGIPALLSELSKLEEMGIAQMEGGFYRKL